MNAPTLALAALLAAAPAVVLAQAMPPDAYAPGDDGPSTALRARMDRVRSDARAAGLAALSSDHRTRVLAIVERFDAGTIADRADAAAQIDAVLSPAEANDELARARQMRADMRAAFSGAGGPQDGGPGGPAAFGGSPRGPDGAAGPGGRRVADPGRFLLQVAADPAKLRPNGMGDRAPQR